MLQTILHTVWFTVSSLYMYCIYILLVLSNLTTLSNLQYLSTHCVLSLVGTKKEEQFSDEQVGPQVEVDGAVVCVPWCPLAAQGGKADGQTHQCCRDSNPENHIDTKLFYTSPGLTERNKTKFQIIIKTEYMNEGTCVRWLVCLSDTLCVLMCYITSIQMNKITPNKWYILQRNTIWFQGSTKYPAAFICLTLPHSSNPQLSPTLHLIFKQQFRAHHGCEVPLCHSKWVHEGGVSDRGWSLVYTVWQLAKKTKSLIKGNTSLWNSCY